MGLPALCKGEALLAAFLRESRALPSPFARRIAAICQQQQHVLAPCCCFEDGEGGTATSPQVPLEAAFSPCLHFIGEKHLALCVVLVVYSGGPSTSTGQSNSCFQFGAETILVVVCFFWEACYCTYKGEDDNMRVTWEQRALQRQHIPHQEEARQLCSPAKAHHACGAVSCHQQCHLSPPLTEQVLSP